jgi:glycerol uptake facilitator protein
LKSRQSVNPRINESSMKAKPLLSLFLAEFIGTTIFAYGVNASGLSEPPHMVLQIFYVSLSLSFSILLTANISGGHLNPAVSWAVCLTKPGSIQAKENIKTFAFYALSQISGAFFGGWVIYFIEDNINSPYPPIT